MNNSTVKSKMKNFYPTFDKTYTITTTQWVKYEVGFASEPTIYPSLTTYETVKFSTRLNNYGWIYSVCVKTTEDLGKPSPYQIQMGTDVNNIPRPGTYQIVNESYTVVNVTVKN